MVKFPGFQLFFRASNSGVERAGLDVSSNREAGRGWSARHRPRSRWFTGRRWNSVGLLRNGGFEADQRDLRYGGDCGCRNRGCWSCARRCSWLNRGPRYARCLHRGRLVQQRFKVSAIVRDSQEEALLLEVAIDTTADGHTVCLNGGWTRDCIDVAVWPSLLGAHFAWARHQCTSGKRGRDRCPFATRQDPNGCSVEPTGGVVAATYWLVKQFR